MALAPRDIPVSRDQVYDWIEWWNDDHEGQTLEEFIGDRIDELDLPDPFVNTAGQESLPDQVPLAAYVMLDITSYDNHASEDS